MVLCVFPILLRPSNFIRHFLGIMCNQLRSSIFYTQHFDFFPHKNKCPKKRSLFFVAYYTQWLHVIGSFFFFFFSPMFAIYVNIIILIIISSTMTWKKKNKYILIFLTDMYVGHSGPTIVISSLCSAVGSVVVFEVVKSPVRSQYGDIFFTRKNKVLYATCCV